MQLPDPRYTHIRELGVGGMGSVHEVHDRELGIRVALKLLTQRGGDALLDLKREFRAVADLRHPGLVQLYHLNAATQPPFFTMELLSGRPVAEHFDGVASVEDAVAFTGQLLDALEHLHAHGVVHGDLKSSNVLVGHDSTVKLVDFGISRVMDDWTQGPRSVGSPGYMAPEVLRRQPITPASDLYAVGGLLHRLLTGHHPYQGASQEIFERQLAGPPPPARQLVPELPEALDWLCSALMAPAPEDRPTLAQVRARLGLAEGATLTTASRFVGREAELSALAGAGERALSGFVVTVLSGESGIGKSAVVDRYVRQASAAGRAVFRGRCQSREVVAYPAFDRVIDAMAAVVRQWPESSREGYRAAISAAATVFPVFGGAKAKGGTQRRLAWDGLAQLLAVMAHVEPVVIVIDDMQWASGEDFELARALRAMCSGCRVHLVAVARPEALRADHPLMRLGAEDGAQVVNVGPLNRDEVAQWVGAAAADAVMAATDGIPFFVQEAVRYGSAAGVASALTARLASLGAAEQRVLRLAALAAGPVEPAALRSASGLVPEAFADAAQVLLGDGILRLTRAPLRYDFHHDHYRQAVLRGVPESARPGLHHELAAALTTIDELDGAGEGASRAGLLYHHWRAAWESDRALIFARRAVEEAEAQLAWERAAAILTELLAEDAIPSDERTAAWWRLAALHERAGDLPRACEALDALGDDPDARLRLAENLVKSGQVDAGIEVFETILAPYGIKLRTGTAATMATLGSLRARLVAWKMAPDDKMRRAPTDADLHELLVYRKLFESMANTKPWYMAEFQMRCQLAARRLDHPSARAFAAALEAVYVVMADRSPDRFDRGRGMIAQALRELRAAANEPVLEILVEGLGGFVGWLEGNWADARPRLEDALAKGRAAGATDTWELFMVRQWLALVCHHAGFADRARQIAAELVEQPRDVVRYSLGAWVLGMDAARCGRLEEARRIHGAWSELLLDGTFTQMHFNVTCLDHAIRARTANHEQATALVREILDREPLVRAAGCQVSSWHVHAWHEPAFHVLDRATLTSGQRGILRKRATALVQQGAPYLSCMGHRALSRLEPGQADAHRSAAVHAAERGECPHHLFLCLADLAHPEAVERSELARLRAQFGFA